MDKSILISGFGGQGVQTMGKLLTYAANDADLNVTFYPAYGAEMRGGTSNCTIVLSDRYIGSPSRNQYDYVVVLNAPSFAKFEKTVKPGGTLYVNSSLIDAVTSRDDIEVKEIPLNELVAEIGSDKALNIIMFGFLIADTQLISDEIALMTLTNRLGKKKEFAELNKKAFKIGIDFKSK